MNHKIIQLPAKAYGVHLITGDIVGNADLTGTGILHVFIQHTSASLAINENASPDVFADITQFFDHLVPEGPHYRHDEEGPDDMPAHIKSILCSSSLTIPFANQTLLMGVWQGIYLLEFRKMALARRIVLTSIKG